MELHLNDYWFVTVLISDKENLYTVRYFEVDTPCTQESNKKDVLEHIKEKYPELKKALIEVHFCRDKKEQAKWSEQLKTFLRIKGHFDNEIILLKSNKL